MFLHSKKRLRWMGAGTSMPHPRYYGGSVMYTRNDTSWLYVLGGDTTGGGVATHLV